MTNFHSVFCRKTFFLKLIIKFSRWQLLFSFWTLLFSIHSPPGMLRFFSKPKQKKKIGEKNPLLFFTRHKTQCGKKIMNLNLGLSINFDQISFSFASFTLLAQPKGFHKIPLNVLMYRGSLPYANFISENFLTVIF